MPPKAIKKRAVPQPTEVMCIVHEKMRSVSAMEQLPSLDPSVPSTWRCKSSQQCQHPKEKESSTSDSASELSPSSPGNPSPGTVSVGSTGVGSGMTPSASTGTASGGNTCDLCNGDMKDLAQEEHHRRAHPHFVAWCEEVLAKKQTVGQGEVKPETIRKIGGIAKKVAVEADAGSSFFTFALNAMRQMNVITTNLFPGHNTYIFGSCIAMGIWDGEGDIDMSMVHEKDWLACEHLSLEQEQKMVMKLTRELRGAGFAFEDLEPIKHTRVPIVKHHSTIKEEKFRAADARSRRVSVQFGDLKGEDHRAIGQFFKGDGTRKLSWKGPRLTVDCTDTTDALRCLTEKLFVPRSVSVRYRCFEDREYKPELFYVDFDLSFRAHGVRNSYLLRGYLGQSVHARAGSLWIKKWSKRSGVNNSKRGYLTSYAVNILWIYFLIRRKHLAFFDPEEVPKLPSNETLEELQHWPVLPKGHLEEFDAEVGQLIADFFRFYATEFDYETEVVSLRKPTVMTKEEMNWLPGVGLGPGGTEIDSALFRNRIWYRLCIDDPYEPNLNLGRHVSPAKFKKLQAEFIYGLDCLQTGSVEKLCANRSGERTLQDLGVALGISMIGETELPSEEAFSRVSTLLGPEVVAAFETENKFSRLFSLHGFSYHNEEQSKDGIPRIKHEHASESYIHDGAREAFESIFAELKAHPSRGVEVIPETSEMNLDTLFYYDTRSSRFFLEKDHYESYHLHSRLIRACVKDSVAVSVGEIHAQVKRRCPRHYNHETVEAVLSTEEGSSYTVEEGVVSFSHRSRKPEVGICTDCHKKGVPVWRDTTDRQPYCQECWETYDRSKQ